MHVYMNTDIHTHLHSGLTGSDVCETWAYMYAQYMYTNIHTHTYTCIHTHINSGLMEPDEYKTWACVYAPYIHRYIHTYKHTQASWNQTSTKPGHVSMLQNAMQMRRTIWHASSTTRYNYS